MSKPTYEVIQRYKKKAYDPIYILVPKGRRNDIANYVNENGESINGLINKLLQEKLGMSTDEWKSKESLVG